MEEFVKWIEENKFKRPVARTLLECYRRVHYFKNGNPYAGMILLSTPSNARQAKELGFITPTKNEYPRQLTWYNLTEKGVKTISKLTERIPWKDEYNEMLFNY